MDNDEILVDARGHRCPVPTLKLRRALEAAADGARLRLLADDPLARIDVPHFLNEIGAQLARVDEESGALSFHIVKGATIGCGAPLLGKATRRQDDLVFFLIDRPPPRGTGERDD